MFRFIFAAVTLITLHVLSRHLAIAAADIDPAKIIPGRVVPGAWMSAN
jgi:hypothetical protein